MSREQPGPFRRRPAPWERPAESRWAADPGGHRTPLVGALRVLVVEDCRGAIDATAEMINSWGYDVRRTAAGPGDLELAAACRPDVLLVDLGTSSGDECELPSRARRLPGLGRALLIAVTGRRRLAAAAGYDYCMPRPVNPDTLETLLLSRQVELSADPPQTPRDEREAHRLPAAAESVTGPPTDGPILVFDDDDRVRGWPSPGRPPEEAAGSPAAGGAEPEGPASPTGDDLQTFGTPDVLPKPFTAAETGRKFREETRRRDDEEAAQDDQWRDDGGQGQRPAR